MKSEIDLVLTTSDFYHELVEMKFKEYIQHEAESSSLAINVNRLTNFTINIQPNLSPNINSIQNQYFCSDGPLYVLSNYILKKHNLTKENLKYFSKSEIDSLN